jgi:hypothetical protein
MRRPAGNWQTASPPRSRWWTRCAPRSGRGREELEACRAKRRSRIITAVLCTVIVAAGILITFLLVTRM